MKISVIARVQDILQNADNVNPSSRTEVEQVNKSAIEKMMGGSTEEAAGLFLEALKLAGFNKELQALCLINVGDFLRRIPVALEEAQYIFNQAARLTQNTLLLSRLKIMEAMIYSSRTERGEKDPEGIRRNVELLREAIRFSRQSEDEEEALSVWSLALSRLAGTVSMWGAPEEKELALKEIEEILPLLNPDSSTATQLKEKKGRIKKDTNPQEAAWILLESAESHMAHGMLPHACFAFAMAAECYCDIGQRLLAKRLLQSAEKLLPKIQRHGNIEFVKTQIAKVQLKCQQ